MKKTKYLFAILFMLVAFLAIGATSVNAETVGTASNFKELKDLMNDNIDVIKLNGDITAEEVIHWDINGNKTLDLNGFSITSSQEIMFKMFYYGDYTVKVINSSNSTSGKINHTYTADYGKTFYLDNAISGKNKTLYIDGVELNESGRAYTVLCFDNNSTDNLIVKNVNSKSFDFSNGFDNYEFSNTVVRPIGTSRVQLVVGNSTITVKDILGENQEIYYQAFDRVGGTMTSSGVADGNLLVKDLWTNNTSDGQDNAITVRYKNGFTVSDVTLSEFYGYGIATEKEIPIKNRGTSALQIKNVSVDGSNFSIVDGSQTNLSAGDTDTTWKIKARPDLDAGDYTATITVTDMSSNTYTSTVKLTVAPKELTDLGIGGVNSTITYGDTYTPTLTGTSELGTVDYTIKYAKLDGESYTDIDYKPFNVGKYKVTISVTNENYVASDASVFFEIVAKTITPTVNTIPDQTYTGEQITPNVSVGNGSGLTFIVNTDYTVEYGTNKDVGEGKVIIKPISGNNFTWDDKEVTFNIVAKELTDSNVTLNQTAFRHTGSAITPEPVVKDGEKTLVLGTDYELSHSNNINIGDNAEVKVTGKGNYKGKVTKNFSIIAKEPQTISFDEASVTKTYGDSSFKITANHTQGNGTVKYTSSDTNVAEVNETSGSVTIKNAGTTEIKATASETDDYGEESATYTLTVEKKEISINRASANSKEYDGTKTAEVDYIIFNGLVYGEILEKDVDYTATAEFDSEGIGYSKPVTVKVVLKDTAKANNYNLPNAEIQTRATIRGKAIKEDWVTVDTTTTYTYNGTEIEPVVTVKDPTGETVLTLTKGTHYTVEYTDNLNAGTGKIKISGMGNYSGIINKEFTINKKNINSTITVDDIPSVTYNGSKHTPEPVVKDGSTTLLKGRDYTVEHRNSTNAGSHACAEVSEVASSNYTFDTVVKNFTINKYEIKASDITLEYTSTVFDNNAKKPSVTVKMGSEVIPPIEYNVDYSNNTNVGTATVKVTIKADSDDFTGEVTKNFEIVDKTLLTISGINNQQVVYTGSPVVLAGNLTVSNGIDPSALTVIWYKEGTEISQPTNVGVYKVEYSYEDDNYIGNLEVDFEITKKESTAPTLNTYKAVAGDKLSSITLPAGFKWVDENETIIAGNKEYSATYTTNNDTTNYTTKNVNVKVYGKSKVDLNTSVNGTGGTISASKTDILEGTTETVKFTPSEGFEINKVEVNGVDKTSSVRNNKLDVVMGNNDVSVVVTYKAIQYTITVKNVENASITPNGIIKVDYNSDKTFTIIAKLGYNLVSVKVNGVEKISEMVYEELTLKNIKADAEIVVVVERNTYEVIEGANQKYIIDKNTEAKFRINAEYILFERGGSVYVDNTLVDPSNYTSKDGSTIITLKKEFVDTLSVGEHTLKVLFNDGEAITTFTVEKHEEQEKDNSLNPKTGDNIIIYVAIASISVIGILTTVVLKRKKK